MPWPTCWVRPSWTRVQRSFAARGSLPAATGQGMRWPKPIRARQDGFGLDAAAVCLTDALQALCDLTGEDATEATIDEVFETFCVGK